MHVYTLCNADRSKNINIYTLGKFVISLVDIRSYTNILSPKSFVNAMFDVYLSSDTARARFLTQMLAPSGVSSFDHQISLQAFQQNNNQVLDPRACFNKRYTDKGCQAACVCNLLLELCWIFREWNIALKYCAKVLTHSPFFYIFDFKEPGFLKNASELSWPLFL